MKFFDVVKVMQRKNAGHFRTGHTNDLKSQTKVYGELKALGYMKMGPNNGMAVDVHARWALRD